MKLLVKGDPPSEEKPTIKNVNRASSPQDQTADLRDSLTALVGKGYTSVTDEDSRGHFARLVSMLGLPAAQKLFTHISIYNQNPNQSRLPLNDKVTQFYDVGSRDIEIDSLLKKVKQFGSGVISGLTDSNNYSNQLLTGKIQEPTPKVKLVVKK
jgi:hypothetical protein